MFKCQTCGRKSRATKVTSRNLFTGVGRCRACGGDFCLLCGLQHMTDSPGCAEHYKPSLEASAAALNELAEVEKKS